jgi:predicted sugar kinase
MQHQIVKGLLKFFEDYGVKAYGMSSFGPSLVGIVESDSEAEKLRDAVQEYLKPDGEHLYICKPNNTGAKIEYLE